MDVNSFRQLQQIYSEGYLGQTMNDSPNKAYGAVPSRHSYKQVPFNSGGSDNMYASMALNNNVPVVADDEEEISKTQIDPRPILSKLEELINKAASDDMTYAVYSLGLIKDYIIHQAK